MTIRAIYEKGVFRPTEKVEFPDPCSSEKDKKSLSFQTSSPAAFEPSSAMTSKQRNYLFLLDVDEAKLRLASGGFFAT